MRHFYFLWASFRYFHNKFLIYSLFSSFRNNALLLPVTAAAGWLVGWVCCRSCCCFCWCSSFTFPRVVRSRLFYVQTFFLMVFTPNNHFERILHLLLHILFSLFFFLFSLVLLYVFSLNILQN